MEKFNLKLQELLNLKNISKAEISKHLQVTSSMVSTWTNGKKIPNLSNSIKLADMFECSLDFLFGLKDVEDKTEFKMISNFSDRLKEIMKENKISQNKLVKETKFNFVNTNGWLNKNVLPNMSTLIELADYLNVSLDYLAGRE